MGRILSGLAKLASCFCLGTTEKELKYNDKPEHNSPPYSDAETTTTLSSSSSKSANNTPMNVISKASFNKRTEEKKCNESLNLEWSSGTRKETATINWTVNDFPGLLELPELMRNEACTFNAGNSVNFPTRWRFNVQRMKNENHIGLFLERLKPLPFKDTIMASWSKELLKDNIASTSNTNVLAVPGNELASSTENCKNDGEHEKVYVHYECIIKRSGYGSTWVHKRTVVSDFKVGKRLGFRKLFTLQDFKEAQEKQTESKEIPLLSEGDTLHMEIKFSFLLQTNVEPVSTEPKLIDNLIFENSEYLHAQLLREQLGQILRSGENADLILIMELDESDKTFSVHKSVLAARSPVFAAMFQSGMKECHSGIVRIKDISSKAMAQVLNYIYSGSTSDLDWKNVGEVQEVIYAADKYSLAGLKNLCNQMMFCGCEVDNATDLLYIAQAHHLPIAMRDISLFIKRNVNEIFAKS